MRRYSSVTLGEEHETDSWTQLHNIHQTSLQWFTQSHNYHLNERHSDKPILRNTCPHLAGLWTCSIAWSHASEARNFSTSIWRMRWLSTEWIWTPLMQTMLNSGQTQEKGETLLQRTPHSQRSITILWWIENIGMNWNLKTTCDHQWVIYCTHEQPASLNSIIYSYL